MCGLSVSMSITIKENWVEEGREKYLYIKYFLQLKCI